MNYIEKYESTYQRMWYVTVRWLV